MHRRILVSLIRSNDENLIKMEDIENDILLTHHLFISPELRKSISGIVIHRGCKSSENHCHKYNMNRTKVSLYVVITMLCLQGIHLVEELICEYTLPVVQAYMAHIQVHHQYTSTFLNHC